MTTTQSPDVFASLRGKRAAVIGGGGGVGAAVSLLLAQHGVDIAMCDIDDEEMEKTRAQIEGMGRRVMARHADVVEVAELDAFYDALGQWTDHLDILVNVAGGVNQGAFMERTRADDARDIRRNYGYVIDSVRAAVPFIRRGGKGGSIVNFTTIEAHRGAAGFTVYAGAKAATTNFTRALAVELAAERIRINCLASDSTWTKGNLSAMKPELMKDLMALPPEVFKIATHIQVPMHENPPLEALANTVLFLVSDLSAYTTGLTQHVDGGAMAAAGFLDWPFGDGHVPAPLAGTLRKFL